MDKLETWLLPIITATVLASLLLLSRLLRHRPAGRAPRLLPAGGGRGNTVVAEWACQVCQRTLICTAEELRPLSPPELALAARDKPRLVGRKLSEYVCPHCEASHCFAVDAKAPVWVGVNFGEPQETSAHCYECQRPLRRPTWPEGMYDGQLDEIPELLPDHGLVCKRCGGVCCVECCEKTTRRRTPDGSLLCPRCFRGPVDLVFHS